MKNLNQTLLAVALAAYCAEPVFAQNTETVIQDAAMTNASKSMLASVKSMYFEACTMGMQSVGAGPLAPKLCGGKPGVMKIPDFVGPGPKAQTKTAISKILEKLNVDGDITAQLFSYVDQLPDLTPRDYIATKTQQIANFAHSTDIEVGAKLDAYLSKLTQAAREQRMFAMSKITEKFNSFSGSVFDTTNNAVNSLTGFQPPKVPMPSPVRTPSKDFVEQQVISQPSPPPRTSNGNFVSPPASGQGYQPVYSPPLSTGINRPTSNVGSGQQAIWTTSGGANQSNGSVPANLPKPRVDDGQASQANTSSNGVSSSSNSAQSGSPSQTSANPSQVYSNSNQPNASNSQQNAVVNQPSVNQPGGASNQAPANQSDAHNPPANQAAASGAPNQDATGQDAAQATTSQSTGHADQAANQPGQPESHSGDATANQPGEGAPDAGADQSVAKQSDPKDKNDPNSSKNEAANSSPTGGEPSKNAPDQVVGTSGQSPAGAPVQFAPDGHPIGASAIDENGIGHFSDDDAWHSWTRNPPPTAGAGAIGTNPEGTAGDTNEFAELDAAASELSQQQSSAMDSFEQGTSQGNLQFQLRATTNANQANVQRMGQMTKQVYGKAAATLATGVATGVAIAATQYAQQQQAKAEARRREEQARAQAASASAAQSGGLSGQTRKVNYNGIMLDVPVEIDLQQNGTASMR